jgi:hypothetical protein
MKITAEIKKIYETLSPDNIKFLEYVNENPDCFKRDQFRALKWNDPGINMTFQPWPAFISRETRDSFKEASTKVFDLILSIPGRIFSNDPVKIGAYLDLPARVVGELLYGISAEHIKGLIGRGDFILAPPGLKCLEFNIAPNLGGWQLPFWESMYLQIPLLAGFVKKYRLRITNKNLLYIYFGHFIDRALAHFLNQDEINILIRTRKGEIDKPAQLVGQKYITPLYKNVLKLKSKAGPLQGEVIFCGFDRVTVKGEHLYYKNKRIHVIIEYNRGEIPPGILDLYKMGRILLINGPVSRILNNKLNLALLSEHGDSDLFTREERAIIKKYIPWTRKLIIGSTTFGAEKIKLEEFVISHRERLVIKPANQSGGKNVHIGSQTPALQWKELAADAFKLEQKWVVQEYIQSHPYLFQAGENGWGQYFAVWGLFVFGSTYGGVWLRVLPRESSRGIINTRQGGQEGIVFEVDKQQ